MLTWVRADEMVPLMPADLLTPAESVCFIAVLYVSGNLALYVSKKACPRNTMPRKSQAKCALKQRLSTIARGDRSDDPHRPN